MPIRFIFSQINSVETTIRTAGLSDADSLAELSEQLGYPVTGRDVRNNLETILAKNGEIILVAEQSGKVTGWIGLADVVHLCDGHYCLINGLVVDSNCHRQGVGRRLVEAARQWAEERKIRVLKVQCNTRRKDAHRFYAGTGFTEIKEQKVFKLKL